MGVGVTVYGGKVDVCLATGAQLQRLTSTFNIYHTKAERFRRPDL